MEYEQVFTRGIPFLIDTKGKLYSYDRANPICIGFYNRDTKECSLDTDFRDKLSESVSHWRASLTATERGKTKPEEKPKKLSNARRNPRKPAAGAGEDTTDKKVRLRRVRTNAKGVSGDN